MISRKGTFYLGVFVFLIPFLGFPTIWKMGLVVIAGFSLIVYSIRFPVPKKPFKFKTKKDTSDIVVNEIQPQITTIPEIVAEKPQENVVIEEKIQSPLPPITKIEPIVKTPRKRVRTTAVKKIKVKE